MKNQICHGFVFAAITLCVVGCKKPAEQAANDAGASERVLAEQSLEEATTGDAHQDHKEGAHEHRFEDPEVYAARWNDPARDVWQKPEEIIAAMEVKPGGVVADIGAGTGYLVAHLSRAVGEAGVVQAIDVERSMVEYIAGKKEELGPATIKPRKVSSESPALGSETVDAVVTLNTWHHIFTREDYAKRVREGLKPGGRFVVVDFVLDESAPGAPMEMRLEPASIVEELKAAGFSSVEIIEETMPRHYMIVGVK